MTHSPVPNAIAAIDLGSNSFHLVVASPQGGDLQIIDRIRDTVRLAAGLDKDNRLIPDAQSRAFACLERFGERLRHLPPDVVRAVGTNTLRLATNAEEFLAAAEQALGHSIEIIAGREEARLIYQGVSHGLPESNQRHLVMDIGGGSTELIIGERYEPLYMESMTMGCVTLTETYFPRGEISAAATQRARLAALQHIEPYQAAYRDLGWDDVIGTSGTIRAVERVIRQCGWAEGITLTGLNKLVDTMLKAGHMDKLKLPGLSERRQPVFVGGVMILAAAFEALGLERMRVSEGALREGILHDLLGRLRHEDVRGRTVAGLGARFHVDPMQAARVERTALALLASAADTWDLDVDAAHDWLRWAAQLHEVGLAVAHSGYHKHGAYIVENADMAGFSRQEQTLLAALVRGHRRKFPAPLAKKLSRGADLTTSRLAVLLRLSATLHRSRSSTPPPRLVLAAKDDVLTLRFPEGWLEGHPLTRADLEQEAEFLKTAGIKLEMA